MLRGRQNDDRVMDLQPFCDEVSHQIDQNNVVFVKLYGTIVENPALSRGERAGLPCI